jgi:CMP-N-acetylneuraminic acid synthetase
MNLGREMKIPIIKALVPIREHSKRVKNKNTRSFCNKPLFYWILKSLDASSHISEIIVDTDSKEIKQYSNANFEVTVLDRPYELCGYDIGIHPLIDFEISNTTGDFFLQTHATNPLLLPTTIDDAIESFFSQDQHDSLFSVNRLQTRLYWQNGQPINHNPENMLKTQDLEPIFEENSNLYIFSRKSFYENNHRIGKKPMMYPMDPLEAIDIDEEHDFNLANILFAESLAGNP